MSQTAPPQFDASEKAELQNLISYEMDTLSKKLKTAAKIVKSNKLDEDVDLCGYDARCYHDTISFYLHLYEPEWSSADARFFWQLDTGPRDIMWATMEERLNIKLFKKIESYINANNRVVSK